MFVQNNRLINAMKKAGFEVKADPRKEWEDRAVSYSVVNGKNIVTWYVQNDKAHCVHCSTLNDGRDSMTDYFPGSFADTIKQAVRHLN